MEEPSPARLYASLGGAALLAAGLLGFFYSSSFGSPGEVGEALGRFAVNGWWNVAAIGAGALGLLVAGFAARAYALWLGLVLTALGVWGLALGSGEAILGILPVDRAADLLRLAAGVLGLAAAASTPRRAAARSGRAAAPGAGAGAGRAVS